MAFLFNGSDASHPNNQLLWIWMMNAQIATPGIARMRLHQNDQIHHAAMH